MTRVLPGVNAPGVTWSVYAHAPQGRGTTLILAGFRGAECRATGRKDAPP